MSSPASRVADRWDPPVSGCEEKKLKTGARGGWVSRAVRALGLVGLAQLGWEVAASSNFFSDKTFFFF